jgi:hypothetical protein
MGTGVLGTNIKNAIDALPAADKYDRLKVMQALGDEIEDWGGGEIEYWSYLGPLFCDPDLIAAQRWSIQIGYWVTNAANNTARGFMAVNLPNGATLLELSIQLQYLDADGHNFTLTLWKCTRTSGNTNIAQLTHTGQTTGYDEVKTETFSDATIDNENNMYIIEMKEMDISRTTNVRVTGVRITYSIT